MDDFTTSTDASQLHRVVNAAPLLTAADLAAGYAASRSCDALARNYRGQMDYTLRRFKAVFGDRNATDFSPADFIAFREHIAATPRTRNRGNYRCARLAPATTDMRVSTIVDMFRWGASEGIVSERIYLSLMDVPLLHKWNRKPNPHAVAAAKKLLPFLPLQIQRLVKLFVYLDARQTELLAMRWRDIDMGNATPTHRAKCRQCRKGSGPCPLHETWTFRPPGTDRSYRLDATAQELLPATAGRDSASPVFSTRDNKAIFTTRQIYSPSQIREFFRRASQQCGSTIHVSLHALRGNRGLLLDNAPVIDDATDATSRQWLAEHRRARPAADIPHTWLLPLSDGSYAILDQQDIPKADGSLWRFYGYAVVRDSLFGGTSLARLILNETDPATAVRYANGNRRDLRRQNISIIDRFALNRGMRKRKTRDGKPCSSKFKGVSWVPDRRKWQAGIRLDGRRKSLGRFDAELDAARAYDAAAREHFKDDAVLNLPDDQTP